VCAHTQTNIQSNTAQYAIVSHNIELQTNTSAFAQTCTHNYTLERLPSRPRTHSRLLDLVDKNPAATEYCDASCGGGAGGRGDENGGGKSSNNGFCDDDNDYSDTGDICSDIGGGIRGRKSAACTGRGGRLLQEHGKELRHQQLGEEGGLQENGEAVGGQEHGEERVGGLGLWPGGEGVEEGVVEVQGDAELDKGAAVVTDVAEGDVVADGVETGTEAEAEAEAIAAAIVETVGGAEAAASDFELGVMFLHMRYHKIAHSSTY
jgi:hypothetical protein